MKTKVRLERALERLREAYPESSIEVQETENPFADGIIVRDNTFVAWIEEGEVIVGESRLSKVLADKEQER